jgi:DNA end-binding protein Ku
MSEIEIPDAKVGPQELGLANQLIDSIASDGFDPTRYKDEVKERIEAQIRRKVEGEEITVPESPTAPEGAKVIDIMDALRASLKRQAGRAAPAEEQTAARPARKSAAKAPKKAATRPAKKSAGRAA